MEVVALITEFSGTDFSPGYDLTDPEYIDDIVLLGERLDCQHI